MEQIGNIFKDYYYIDNDKVYNASTNRYLKKDSNNAYTLICKDGKAKHITFKALYKLVYGVAYAIDDIEDLPDE